MLAPFWRLFGDFLMTFWCLRFGSPFRYLICSFWAPFGLHFGSILGALGDPGASTWHQKCHPWTPWAPPSGPSWPQDPPRPPQNLNFGGPGVHFGTLGVHFGDPGLPRRLQRKLSGQSFCFFVFYRCLMIPCAYAPGVWLEARRSFPVDPGQPSAFVN